MNRRRFLTVAAAAVVVAATATGAESCAAPAPKPKPKDPRVYQCSCGNVFYGRDALDEHLKRYPKHIAKRIK